LLAAVRVAQETGHLVQVVSRGRHFACDLPEPHADAVGRITFEGVPGVGDEQFLQVFRGDRRLSSSPAALLARHVLGGLVVDPGGAEAADDEGECHGDGSQEQAQLFRAGWIYFTHTRAAHLVCFLLKLLQGSNFQCCIEGSSLQIKITPRFTRKLYR